MAWKVYADGILIPNADRIDLKTKGKVTVYSREETLATPVTVDHLVAVWERGTTRPVPRTG